MYNCSDRNHRLEKTDKTLYFKSYRVLFIILRSKEYIILKTVLKASFNFHKHSKVIGHSTGSFLLSVKEFCYVYSNGQLVWTLWQLCQSLQRRWTKPPRRNKQVWLPNICKRERFLSTETSNSNSIHISTLHFKYRKNKPVLTSELGKQQQQDSSRITVRSSQWDSGEKLKLNVWRLKMQTPLDARGGWSLKESRKEPVVKNYIVISSWIFPFLGRGFCIENITETKQSYLKHSPEDYRKSIDHNNNEEKYDNIKTELVYLFPLTNLFADVVYRWFCFWDLRAEYMGKNSKDIVINSAPEIER